MTGVAPQTEGAAPGPESPAAAPGLAPDGAATAAPRIVTAKPDLVVELPFTLAAATILLKGEDLDLQAGDQLVVIKGYGPALEAGAAPKVLDPRGKLKFATACGQAMLAAKGDKLFLEPVEALKIGDCEGGRERWALIGHWASSCTRF